MCLAPLDSKEGRPPVPLSSVLPLVGEFLEVRSQGRVLATERASSKALLDGEGRMLVKEVDLSLKPRRTQGVSEIVARLRMSHLKKLKCSSHEVNFLNLGPAQLEALEVCGSKGEGHFDERNVGKLKELSFTSYPSDVKESLSSFEACRNLERFQLCLRHFNLQVWEDVKECLLECSWISCVQDISLLLVVLDPLPLHSAFLQESLNNFSLFLRSLSSCSKVKAVKLETSHQHSFERAVFEARLNSEEVDFTLHFGKTPLRGVGPSLQHLVSFSEDSGLALKSIRLGHEPSSRSEIWENILDFLELNCWELSNVEVQLSEEVCCSGMMECEKDAEKLNIFLEPLEGEDSVKARASIYCKKGLCAADLKAALKERFNLKAFFYERHLKGSFPELE